MFDGAGAPDQLGSDSSAENLLMMMFPEGADRLRLPSAVRERGNANRACRRVAVAPRPRGSRSGRTVLLAALLAFPGAAIGQDPADRTPPAPFPARADGGVSVSVITVGPGEKTWERFGHNALWIRDASRGLDLAYNWGVFDFQQAGFVRRLLQGRMLYSMQPFPGSASVNTYIRDGRSVWVQELNLTSEQVQRLQRFLVWNSRPENRDYRYDYFRDNCSTRLRDALNGALGGQLRRDLAPIETPTTYRSQALRLTSGDLAISAGLLLALGNPADRSLSAWEESFIPMQFQSWLRTISITGPDGTTVPLVAAEWQISGSERTSRTHTSPALLGVLLGMGLLMGGGTVTLASLDPRSEAARAAVVLLSSLWALTAGVAGVLLLGLWSFTDHWATYSNENILQVNPLSLGLVMLAALAPTRRGAAHYAARLAAVAAGLSLLGALVQVLPGFDQANGGLIALALPAHLGSAVALHIVKNRHS